jgi:hypothetical protein
VINPVVNSESALCRLLRQPLSPMARSLAPALVAALPTLALVIEMQSLRITQLEGDVRRLKETPAHVKT